MYQTIVHTNHSVLIISRPLSYLTLPTDLNIPLLSSFRASIDINLAMLLILIKLCYRTALFVIEVHAKDFSWIVALVKIEK